MLPLLPALITTIKLLHHPIRNPVVRSGCDTKYGMIPQHSLKFQVLCRRTKAALGIDLTMLTTHDSSPTQATHPDMII